MKKLVAISIVAAMLLASGAAFAQTTNSPQPAAHGVNVAIPSLVMIRFTLGTSNAAVTSPTPVAFAWDAATFPFEGSHGPTNLTGATWDSVRVFANAQGWNLTVQTSLSEETTFEWSSISVAPTSGPVSEFNLGAGLLAPHGLLSNQPRTDGWLDLGFGPAQYAIELDGSTPPGTYTATVTYTIANP